MTQENIDDTSFGRPQGFRHRLELGGENGIRALEILQSFVVPLMNKIERRSGMSLKPCDVFDLIGFGRARLLAVMFDKLNMAIAFFLTEIMIRSGWASGTVAQRSLVERIKDEIRKELFGDKRLLEEEQEKWSDPDLDGWVARVEGLAGIDSSKIAARRLGEMVANGGPTEMKDCNDGFSAANAEIASMLNGLAMNGSPVEMGDDDDGWSTESERSVDSKDHDWSTDSEGSEGSDDDDSFTLAKFWSIERVDMK